MRSWKRERRVQNSHKRGGRWKPSIFFVSTVHHVVSCWQQVWLRKMHGVDVFSRSSSLSSSELTADVASTLSSHVARIPIAGQRDVPRIHDFLLIPGAGHPWCWRVFPSLFRIKPAIYTIYPGSFSIFHAYCSLLKINRRKSPLWVDNGR